MQMAKRISTRNRRPENMQITHHLEPDNVGTVLMQDRAVDTAHLVVFTSTSNFHNGRLIPRRSRNGATVLSPVNCPIT
jgi:hypothetical protein